MIRYFAMTAIAHTTAFLVGLRRQVVYVSLEDRECEAAGVPYGTATKAITVTESGPWWHCRVYLKQCGSESCVDVRGLGMCAEVWYLRDVAARSGPQLTRSSR